MNFNRLIKAYCSESLDNVLNRAIGFYSVCRSIVDFGSFFLRILKFFYYLLISIVSTYRVFFTTLQIYKFKVIIVKVFSIVEQKKKKRYFIMVHIFMVNTSL